jgi:hypothetical protein
MDLRPFCVPCLTVCSVGASSTSSASSGSSDCGRPWPPSRPSVVAAGAPNTCQDRCVHLEMTLLDAAAQSDGWVQKPFGITDGFKSTWWVGSAKGPAVWCSVADAALGEVARAQVKLRSFVGAAYPTRPLPAGGATEIDLLEVREDLRHGGLGIGRDVVAMIGAAFPGPYVALSLDATSDGFWRRLGWREHDHESAAAARADGARLPAVLFESPE